MQVDAGRALGIGALMVLLTVATTGAAIANGTAGAGPADVAPDGSTALHLAVERDDLDGVNRLLVAGADVHAATQYGVTPIWLAATNGHSGIAQRLLEAGADATTTNPANGETVLMFAARSGNVQTVSALLDYGADVNAVERLRSQTALMWAAASGHAAAVRVLLDRGAKVAAWSATGMTPLMFAIRAGDVASTRLLVQAGADLTETYWDGTTPLVLAILNARYELAAALLDEGADPNGYDPHGSPLHVLVWLRNAKDQYLADNADRVPTGNLDSMALAGRLLDRGASINAQIDWVDGPPVFGYFTSYGGGVRVPPDIATTRYSPLSYVGATPFWVASYYTDVPMMRFLASKGADPSIKTRQGVTPLLAASGVGLIPGSRPNEHAQVFEAVQFTHELGNDVHALVESSDYIVGDWRWNKANALHGAAVRGNLELIQWLIDKGVSLEQVNDGGWYPAHAAEAVFILGIQQHQVLAAKLIRRSMAERGLAQPRERGPEEIQTDGNKRPQPASN